MRENNRNSIEKCRKKLPQFTTMNVIDGQAGLISYFSLIFYSLTIDNILNIVVLLILAGVTIATLTGPNGIITRANEAKEATEQAKQDELRRLTALEAATNIDGTTHTETITQEGTDEQKIVIVKIPAGFAVSQVEGENTIEDGLVVIDKNGNEFVWVPVSQENFETEFVRKSGYYNGSLQAMTNYGEADGNSETGDNTNTKVTESSITKEEVKKMYKSVKDNGGFYIGRYEAGKDKANSEKVIIQKGVQVYNNVAWSKNKTMNEESTVDGTESNPDGAIELARNFDTENGYTNATSTLCYGVQWDAVMSWIDSAYKTGTCNTDTSFVANSTGKGNYKEDENINKWKGNVALTGASEHYKVNNIYDLAGNVNEWTMESRTTSYRVSRGGPYSYTGFIYPVSCRGNNNPSNIVPYIGFRITLYL